MKDACRPPWQKPTGKTAWTVGDARRDLGVDEVRLKWRTEGSEPQWCAAIMMMEQVPAPTSCVLVALKHTPVAELLPVARFWK